MVNKAYQTIITKSLKVYIWVFLLVYLLFSLYNVLQLNQVMNQVNDLYVTNKSIKSVFDPSYFIYSIVISVIFFIIWLFIKINLNQNKKSAPVFLSNLFKVLFLVTIYNCIQFVLASIYTPLSSTEGFSEDKIQLLMSLKEEINVLWSLSHIWDLLIIVFLFIVVKSYKKIIPIKFLNLFKIFTIVAFILKFGVDSYNIYSSIEQLSIVFNLTFSIVISIVWLLWILNYISAYIELVAHDESLIVEIKETDTFNTNDRSLKNSINKFGILIIAMTVVLIRFVVIVINLLLVTRPDHQEEYQLITLNEFFDIYNSPYLLAILVELLIYIWLYFSIFSKTKKNLIAPLLSLFILYTLTWFQSIIHYGYLQLVWEDDFNRSSMGFEMIDNLYTQIFLIPLFIVLLGLIIWNYRIKIKPIIIHIVSYIFIVLIIGSLIIYFINLDKTNTGTEFNFFHLIDTTDLERLFLNPIIFIFWIMFTFFYSQEVNKQK